MKRFSPEQIITRAAHYGVTIALVEGSLRLQAADKNKITDDMRRQVKAHKDDLLAYLQMEADILANPPLCATCLDAGRETPALDDAADDDFMYCQAHHPAHKTRFIEGVSNEQYMQLLKQEAQAIAHEAAQPKRQGVA